MAEGFARQIAPDDVTVMSAGLKAVDSVHPMAVEVLKAEGCDISGNRTTPLSEINLFTVNLVVTLCVEAERECQLTLPGHPTKVSWNVPEPAAPAGDAAALRKAFQKCARTVKQLVHDLFEHGYFDSLTHANCQAHMVIDNLKDGIMAHDVNRKITYFNREAEAITGFSRAEVIGRDCHDVFHNRLCGERCAFTGPHPPSFNHLSYPAELRTKKGDTVKVELFIDSIRDSYDNISGVVLTFRDLTYDNFLEKKEFQNKTFSGIVGRDKKMLEVYDFIRSLRDSAASVLIQGESGTGKELVASAIHAESARAEGLFVPVNCGALPENLLESELFGHVRGAFTGAIRDKKGRFELADGGTIFLDEIGDISQAMQVKLLRVLQEGVFERVGDTKSLQSDFRVICASNKNLNEEIKSGRFREDLYYRICVVPIHLPPLRHRADDIPLLVEHILTELKRETEQETIPLSPGALDMLLSYPWPGNIRELQNALQFALVKCKGPRIEINHLPPHIVRNRETTIVKIARSSTEPPTRGRKKKLSEGSVRQAMYEANGNKAEAARILGVGRATLYRFINEDMKE